MMYKKIRKYLIVLMAVLMAASFAVIPTSASMSSACNGGGGTNTYGSGPNSYKIVTSWAECYVSPYGCWSSMFGPDDFWDYSSDSSDTHVGTVQSICQSPTVGEDYLNNYVTDWGTWCHC